MRRSVIINNKLGSSFSFFLLFFSFFHLSSFFLKLKFEKSLKKILFHIFFNFMKINLFTRTKWGVNCNFNWLCDLASFIWGIYIFMICVFSSKKWVKCWIDWLVAWLSDMTLYNYAYSLDEHVSRWVRMKKYAF